MVVNANDIVSQYIVTKSQQVVYPVITSEVISEVIDPNAYLPRFIGKMGTGALEWVFFSEGEAEYDEAYMHKNGPRILQVVNGEDPDSCGQTSYPSSRIWFGATRPAVITVNGREIGAYTEGGTGSHGFIIDWPIAAGDTICVQTSPGAAFHIVVGPDVDMHYDSYCYRTDEC